MHYIRIGVFLGKTPQDIPLRLMTPSPSYFFSSSLNSNKTTVIDVKSLGLSL